LDCYSCFKDGVCCLCLKQIIFVRGRAEAPPLSRKRLDYIIIIFCFFRLALGNPLRKRCSIFMGRVF